MSQPRRRLAARRKAAGFTQESLAEALRAERSTVARWEAGETEPQPELRRRLARCLGIPLPELAELLAAPVSAAAVLSGPPTQMPVADGETSRQALHEILTMRTPSAASLDEWEQSTWRYGQASKDRAPVVLLADLTTDFDALVPVMAGCRSSVSLRRLTRVAARLAGLVCLTLIKLDDRTAFRRWARTARLAAREVDDPGTHAWVLSQEAYGHYYAQDLHEAISVARAAQDAGHRGLLSQNDDHVGPVLAAALEARAHAALGRADVCRTALHRAEELLEAIPSPSTVTAFSYDEAQLRFHESNACTHLGDVQAAWAAQDRALELVAPDDYMDRGLTLLDRADCLMQAGDQVAGLTLGRDCLLALRDDQRPGIITARTWQVLDAVPAAERQHPAAIELRDLLMSTTTSEDVS